MLETLLTDLVNGQGQIVQITRVSHDPLGPFVQARLHRGHNLPEVLLSGLGRLCSGQKF